MQIGWVGGGGGEKELEEMLCLVRFTVLSGRKDSPDAQGPSLVSVTLWLLLLSCFNCTLIPFLLDQLTDLLICGSGSGFGGL